MPRIYIIVLLLCFGSCQMESDTKYEANRFQPKTLEGNRSFKLDEFIEVNENEIKDYEFWMMMNHSDIKVGAFKKDGAVYFKTPKFESPYYFDLEDGKLEVTNHGEFGGEFNFIPNNREKDTIRILDINIIYIFEFKGDIYFLGGIAHMEDQGGGIARLIREGDEFKYEEMFKLDSSPEAMTIYKDQILIAGHQNFTVIRDFKKVLTLENTFWSSLYPNSVVAVNDNEVYIGLRGGYAKLSLISKEIKYYKHKSVKSEE